MTRHRLQIATAFLFLIVTFTLRAVCYLPSRVYSTANNIFNSSLHFLTSDRHERRAANVFRRRYR